MLIDIVIDRADFMMRSNTHRTSNPRSSTPTPKGKQTILDVAASTSTSLKQMPADAEQQFNAEIDILAARIKIIHDRIRDKASRKNVKLSLLGLEKRLKYAVRTRPPPKRDIFALEETPTAGDAINVPKQRDFMRQWTQRKKEAEAEVAAGQQLKGQQQQQQQQQQHREDEVLEKTSFRGRRRGAAKNVPVAVG